MTDEATARAFYLDLLGFTIDFAFRISDDAPLYLQITRGDCTIQLSGHHADAVPGGALRIEADDLDALYQELLDRKPEQAGLNVRDTPWRTREMTIVDPSGNRLIFWQPTMARRVDVSFDVGDLRGDMTPVGLTAQWVAANRALETESPDPLYRDPFARELAGPAGFAMMMATRAVLGLTDATRPEPYLTIRTKYLDDSLIAAVKESGFTQVVILAAGMDARAFRLEWPAGVKVFEVDRDDIFQYKEATLARLGAKASCDRRLVRADLSQPWTQQLVDAGFDVNQPAAFLTEGLLMYLDEASVTRLFNAIRTLAAPGSWIAMDITNTDMLTSNYTAAYMKKLAEAGCPWLFGVDDPGALLAQHGWQATVASPGDAVASYGRWPHAPMPRSVPGMPRTFFVTARRMPEQPGRLT